jgi:hypothetical protein
LAPSCVSSTSAGGSELPSNKAGRSKDLEHNKLNLGSNDECNYKLNRSIGHR